MQTVLVACGVLVSVTNRYFTGLFEYGVWRRPLRSGSLYVVDPEQAVHVFSLWKTVELFLTPHYRDVSLQADMRKNLSNVAVPGTGVPLSVFCVARATLLVFLLAVYPVACLVAAAVQYVACDASLTEKYQEFLMRPRHWFAVWRLNCVIVAAHAHATGSDSYRLENKAAFLQEAQAAGLAVSPFLRDAAVVVKHRSMEGGMGLHFYTNFLAGGDWIIQPRLRNCAELAQLLPSGAPLSTFRVVTRSRHWLRLQAAGKAAEATGSTGVAAYTDVDVVTVVFRAGLVPSETDHTSVCFNVDPTSGVCGQGWMNTHWYRLGAAAAGDLTGAVQRSAWTHHPQSGAHITGFQVPGCTAMLSVTRRAHARLLPDVPLAGWDVAVTPDGPKLLEVNLSCNLFNGEYDQEAYTAFAADMFSAIHAYV